MPERILAAAPLPRNGRATGPASHRCLVAHYERCLDAYGDTHRGVDWPNAEDARLRYRIMGELFLSRMVDGDVVLDFGCGAGHFLDYLLGQRSGQLVYVGLDASQRFVALCRNKYPHYRFIHRDILEDAAALGTFEYIVINGVFTERRELSQEEMWQFMTATLRLLWRHCTKALAFNVMSKQVQWERDDLFHVGVDRVTGFLAGELSRHCVIRQDYGLYDYTVYVYKEPPGVR